MNASTAGICASYNTLSGAQHGQPPAHTLAARAGAAHAAGIPNIGACADDLGDADPWWLSATVRRAGVAVTVLEWVNLDARDQDAEHKLFKLADVLHAHRLSVGVCSPDPPDMRALAKSLRHLAVKAADHEVTLAVEPVVFGGVPTIEDVEHLIEDAGSPANVGTLLDAWQLARAAWTTDVSHITPGLVAAVQLCGVDYATPHHWPDELFHDAQCGRRLPGEGDFNLAEWFANLRAAGVNAPIEVEVISDELRGMELYAAAARVAASWRAFAPEAVPVA